MKKSLKNFFKKLFLASLALPVSACASWQSPSQSESITSSVSLFVYPWSTARSKMLSTLAVSNEQAISMVLQRSGAVANTSISQNRFDLGVQLNPGALLPTQVTTNTSNNLTENSGVEIAATVQDSGGTIVATDADGNIITDSNGNPVTLTANNAQPVTLPTSSTTNQIENSTEETAETFKPKELTPLDIANVQLAALQASIDQLQRDPKQVFAAAASLQAQVNLLDAKVRNATELANVVPYLIELDVAVNTRKRELPYDLLTAVNFALYKHGNQAPMCGDLNIIPLFSKADFERINLTDVADRLNDVSVNLSALVSKFGISAGSQNLRRDRTEFVSNNLNALSSIAKTSDRSIEIRNGARWIGQTDGTDRYKLISPSQTIFALALIGQQQETGDGVVCGITGPVSAASETKTFYPLETKFDETDAAKTLQSKQDFNQLTIRAIALQNLVDGETGKFLSVGSKTTYENALKSIVTRSKLRIGARGTVGSPVFECKGQISSHFLDADLTKRLNISDLEYCNKGYDRCEADDKANAIALLQKRVADDWLHGRSERLDKTLICMAGGAEELQNIRLELANLKPQTIYSVANSQVPIVRYQKLPIDPAFVNQPVFASQKDNQQFARLVLNSDDIPSALFGTATFEKKDQSGKSAGIFKKYFVPASSFSLKNNVLTVTFPKKSNDTFLSMTIGQNEADDITQFRVDPRARKLGLEDISGFERTWLEYKNIVSLDKNEPEVKAPTAAIQTGLSVLTPKSDNTAEIDVFIKASNLGDLLGRFLIKSHQGQIASIEGAESEGEFFAIAVNKRFTMKLKNLTAGTTLRLAGNLEVKEKNQNKFETIIKDVETSIFVLQSRSQNVVILGNQQ